VLAEDVDARWGAQKLDGAVTIQLQKEGAERTQPPEGFAQRGGVLPVGLREYADQSHGLRPAAGAFAEEPFEYSAAVGGGVT
jgi:hypothetical protein